MLTDDDPDTAPPHEITPIRIEKINTAPLKFTVTVPTIATEEILPTPYIYNSSLKSNTEA